MECSIWYLVLMKSWNCIYIFDMGVGEIKFKTLYRGKVWLALAYVCDNDFYYF